MNEKFIKQAEKKKITAYRISKETGISCTVLTDLFAQRKNINNVTAETIYKLCLYFHCNIEDLIDTQISLNKITGKYKNIIYKWENNILFIKENNNFKPIENIKIKDIYVQNNISFAKMYAETIIDEYIELKKEKEFYETFHINAQK